MPKLAAVVESLDTLEESVRGFYVESDGKYVLDTDVDNHPAVAGLKATVKSVRGERELTAKELKTFRDLGLTPTQIAELKEKVETGQFEKADLEKVVAKRVKEVEERVATDLAERDQLKADLRKLRLTDKVRIDALAAGIVEEEVDDVIRLTEGRFDLNDKGKVIVLDDDKDPTGMTPKEWFEKEYKKLRPNRFKGTGASGTGARGSTGGSGADDAVRNLPGGRMVEAAFANRGTK